VTTSPKNGHAGPRLSDVATQAQNKDGRRHRGPAPAGRSNIRDVARHAGVSVATVSRVIGGSDLVTDTTRQKVLAAVDVLGFVVNAHARALGGRGTPTIALVVDEVFGPSFAVLARGVENFATERRHLFVMSTTQDNPEREQQVVGMLQQHRPAAVLWLGPLQDNLDQEERVAQHAKTLAEVDSQLVICGRAPLRVAPHIDCVEYDNSGGARAVTEHLIALGHRNILFVGALPGHLSSQRRVAGYREPWMPRDSPPRRASPLRATSPPTRAAEPSGMPCGRAFRSRQSPPS
jgi:LacI family transcriptional regulator